MLFTVIERFKEGNARVVASAFDILADGCPRASSTTRVGRVRCFQVMEARHSELLNAWVSRWHDLIDFEIVHVLTSNDFWSRIPEHD